MPRLGKDAGPQPQRSILPPQTLGIRRARYAVISGTGLRRRFSDEFRAKVVEETLARNEESDPTRRGLG